MSLRIGNKEIRSRLIIGSAQYPSPEEMKNSIIASGAGIVTVSLRRQNPNANEGAKFWEIIKSTGCEVLPNTAGCKTAKEAITTAQMARELFNTTWIKLETVGDEYTLQPDPIELLEAARVLNNEGFEVFPYCTEDLSIAQRLVDCGCSILMPWASPIGSAQGILNEYALRTLRERLPDVTLVVDAGIGKPSEAARVMELGYNAVLVNSAIALADDPVDMGKAFAAAVNAGRLGYEAGLINTRDMARPSTPVPGTPFWNE